MNGHAARRESKSKGVRWRALVFVDAEHGGPRTETHGTFDLKREAEAKITKVLDAYYRGVYRKPSRLTVAALYEKWRKVRRPEWSANTLRHHTLNWRHHVKDAFADDLADWLGKDEVADWQAAMLEAGCAPKSVMSYRGTLHAMYEWGLSVELVTVNPVAAVKPPKFDRAEHDALTVKEMRAHLEAVRKTRLWPGLLLGAGGGMRRGEFLAVRWTRFCEGGLRVCHRRGNLTGKGKALVFGPPKTKAGARFVPLPAYMLAELAALKLQRQAKWASSGLPWDDDALVCCGADGQPIAPDGFTGAVWRFRKNHHLPDSFHAHAFRHGVVEAMLAAGERPEVVSAIVGHKHIATTLGIYAHATEAAKRQAGGRYGVLWGDAQAEPEKDLDSETGDHPETITGEVDELSQRRARRMPA